MREALRRCENLLVPNTVVFAERNESRLVGGPDEHAGRGHPQTIIYDHCVMKKKTIALLLLFLSPALHAADTPRFDGAWDATLSCPKSPDGAKAYSFEFDVLVKNGVLHGERGVEGKPGWMTLDGPIKEDGSAALLAEGITNFSEYAINHVQKGTPYKHAVSAQFEDKHGRGNWITVRTCDFTFDKKD
jgi:hypothetical protein